MNKLPRPEHDSVRIEGGAIPGGQGAPAFYLGGAEPSAIPILIAVPHAGRAYPGGLIERMRHPAKAALKLEDRYADRLGEQVARATGAALLVAHAPRAMIDLNRAADDVDWDMFAQGKPEGVGSYSPGARVRNGLGLIPRRLPGLGELWKRRHDAEDLAQRIAQIHAPYHACLSERLARIRGRWGAALLIDLHSMPPLGFQGALGVPEFVLGDRFGATCHGNLIGSAFDFFNAKRRVAVHNQPYAGGYVLERHANPAQGIHAIQLEIDRTSYLDHRQAEPGEGFAGMVALLVDLVRRLATGTAEIGRLRGAETLAQAAE